MYLASKYQDEEEGRRQLRMREHDDVHQIRISW